MYIHVCLGNAERGRELIKALMRWYNVLSVYTIPIVSVYILLSTSKVPK